MSRSDRHVVRVAPLASILFAIALAIVAAASGRPQVARAADGSVSRPISLASSPRLGQPSGPPPSPPSGPHLGRLLLTPAQRAALDHPAPPATPSSELAPGDAATPGAAAEGEPPPEFTRVDGVMRSDAGVPVVWINGKPQRLDGETRPAPYARRVHGDEVLVAQPDGSQVRLRPGQQEAVR